MLNCCGSGDKNAPQRCSYTAMAFARNRTSSGTANSGNSMRNSMRQDSINRFNLRRQQSRESNVPTVHVCPNGKATLTTPGDTEHSPITTEENTYKNNKNQDISVSAVNEHTPKSPETPLEMSSPLEMLTPLDIPTPLEKSSPLEISSPLETVMLENNTVYLKDTLKDNQEEYHKEIKLKIIQRQKEYG